MELKNFIVKYGSHNSPSYGNDLEDVKYDIALDDFDELLDNAIEKSEIIVLPIIKYDKIKNKYYFETLNSTIHIISDFNKLMDAINDTGLFKFLKAKNYTEDDVVGQFSTSKSTIEQRYLENLQKENYNRL
jgi:hypothetical protein